jgi:hypothetical protein
MGMSMGIVMPAKISQGFAGMTDAKKLIGCLRHAAFPACVRFSPPQVKTKRVLVLAALRAGLWSHS